MAAGDEPILNPVTPPTPASYRLNGSEIHLHVLVMDAADNIIGLETVQFTKDDLPLVSPADRQTIISAARIILRAKGRIV